MRRNLLIAVAAAAALLFAGAAQAAPFAGGQLILKVGALPPITLPSNPGSFVTDLGGPIQEQVGAFGPADIDLPDSLFTGVPQISDLRINQLAKPGVTATFSSPFVPQNDAGPSQAGNFGGDMPLAGTATICVLGCGNVQIPVPLSLAGVGGTTTTTFGGENIFVRNGNWTAGVSGGPTPGFAVVTVPNTTPGGRSGNPGAGISHTANSNTGAGTTLPFKGHTTGSGAKGVGTVLQTMTASTTTFMFNNMTIVSTFTTRQMTLTGFDGRDANGIGTVQLVAPGRADTGGQLAGSLGIFSIQQLTFVPEPGTLLLLGSGVAGLAVVGRRRMRK